MGWQLSKHFITGKMTNDQLSVTIILILLQKMYEIKAWCMPLILKEKINYLQLHPKFRIFYSTFGHSTQ